MEKSNKRGKIPQSDWPLIMARYEAGETLASIARTYDCSPPAISYIVSRNRDKPANETPPPAPEPQLIKNNFNGSSVDSTAAEVEEKVTPAAAFAAPAAEAAPPQRDGGERAPMAQAAGPGLGGAGERQRPKLHLGFGNGNGNGNANGNNYRPGAPPQPAQPESRPSLAAPRQPLENGASNRNFTEMREVNSPSQMAPLARKNGGALDQELRSRIDGDITAFLSAFDAVLAADTQESRFGLKEATDRLLRAGARTRIELERLEAKVPLTPRDGGGHGGGAAGGWRYR